MPFRKRAQPRKAVLAKQFRRNPSPPEAMLWRFLAGKQTGLKFRRQEVILGWIADFYCAKKRAIVEVDGACYHDAARDAIRDRAMAERGIRTIRYPASEVMKSPRAVVADILSKLNP